MAGILDSFDKRELNEFSKDFKELMRVAFGMGKLYGRATEKLSEYTAKYKSLIDLFNNKYSGVKIRIFKTVDELKIVVLLDEKSVKDLFTGVASNVFGLKSVGVGSFDEANLDEAEKFSNKIAAIKDELYLSYYYHEKKADTFYLKFNNKENMVGLNFNFDIIWDEESPEFKICAYYALKGGFDGKIDFYNEAASFGFVDVLSEEEQRVFLDKFEPRMLE